MYIVLFIFNKNDSYKLQCIAIGAKHMNVVYCKSGIVEKKNYAVFFFLSETNSNL